MHVSASHHGDVSELELQAACLWRELALLCELLSEPGIATAPAGTGAAARNDCCCSRACKRT